ncbi:hypothetical protein EJ02DRAFT_156856 [Clathrospora elynae]|uniref:Uncharacterized protein n=1 Tax=Clathrospora elynae TaxID=706981 RepID=A0A6A5SW55_9PLEO|nr:hypothetical protein EJ02DRAFT_156856 [Clathrospora elynae]
MVTAGTIWRQLPPYMRTPEWIVTLNKSHFAICDLDWYTENKTLELHIEGVYAVLFASDMADEPPSEHSVSEDLESNSNASNALLDSHNGESVPQCEHDKNAQTEADEQSTSPAPNANHLPIASPHEQLSEDPDTEPSPARELSPWGNAWGLLITRIDNGEKFARIGRFKVPAEEGGLDAFKFRPYKQIEIL